MGKSRNPRGFRLFLDSGDSVWLIRQLAESWVCCVGSSTAAPKIWGMGHDASNEMSGSGFPWFPEGCCGDANAANAGLAYHGNMASGLTYIRKTTSPEATKQLAATLAPYLKAGDVVVLEGDLGAGKTQFVQGVAAGLGVPGQVTSPTFNILLAYAEGSLPLYHFDLYRLERPEDLEDVGYFETLDGDGASFVEWGGKFPDALPYGYLEVVLQSDAQGVRTVRAHAYGERARQLLFLWAKDSKSRLMKV